DGEDGGEGVSVAAIGTGASFQRVGLAGTAIPRDPNVISLLADGSDSEQRGAIGRIGGGEEFLQVAQPIAIGIRVRVRGVVVGAPEILNLPALERRQDLYVVGPRIGACAALAGDNQP